MTDAALPIDKSITQSSGGRNDMDPKTCVVTQAPSKEEEKKDDLGQSNTMPVTNSPRFMTE